MSDKTILQLDDIVTLQGDDQIPVARPDTTDDNKCTITEIETYVKGNADTTPTEDSDNLITSGAVKAAMDEGGATVQELIETKANKDGYYSGMAVGLSENLISPDGTTNNEPYIYRTTAGSASVSNGNAEIKKIKGNSIVWNQRFTDNSSYYNLEKVKNVSYNNHTLSFTTDAISQWIVGSGRHHSAIIGHKYLVKAEVYSNKQIIQQEGGTKFILNTGNDVGTINIFSSDISANTWTKLSIIHTNTLGRSYGFEFKVAEETDVQVKNYQIFDLTQMFGAGNEPATVEEFENLFPNDYYEYNDGEIVSTNVNALKSVGFNQYNHTTGKADVIKGNQYQITGTYTAITYSDSTAITPDSNGLFTPTKNDTLTITGGNNTNTCVHLTWSGYRNGDYEPYEEHTISIPISTIKDANNNVLFPDGLCSAGSVYDEITSTKAVKRIGKVDLGTLTWVKDTQNYFFVDLTNSGVKRSYNKLIALYEKGGPYTTLLMNKQWNIEGTHRSNQLNIKDDSYTTAAAFKAAMNGVYMYYELATPIEVDFATTPQDFGTTLNLTYKEDDFGTEEVLSNGADESGKPVTSPFNSSTLYMSNLRDKIRNIDGENGALMENSLDELMETLGTALGGTLTKEWNATNKKWTFSFTQTPAQQNEPNE